MADIDEDDLLRGGALDDEGSPRPRGGGRPRDWDPWEKAMIIGQVTAASAAMFTVLAFILAPAYLYGAREAPDFSMELTGFEGLNATTTVVSPVFILKARMGSPHALRSWCYDSGEVVVSYSGVALAWGHAPRFCVRKRAPTEFTVRPWGRAVGLSDDLRRRLALDTAQLSVEMKLFDDDKGVLTIDRGPLLRKFQVPLGPGKHV